MAMISALKKILSKLNRVRKNKFKSGYVSIGKFNRIAEKYELLIDDVVGVERSFTQQPAIRCLQAYKVDSVTTDLCLFVSFASEPEIKSHVRHHIEALIAQGIAVVLVINTDADLGLVDQIHMPGLSGLYVRENKGFDFGAWSHIYKLIELADSVDRLYLINDSLIGPLTSPMLGDVIKKVRTSRADFLGLTANTEPVFHVQSFFLVIGKRLLNDQRFSQFFKNIWNLPTKDMVIDFYEKRLTRVVQNLGFQVDVLFDTRHLQHNKSDPVIHSIDELLKMNFPYVKVSMALKPEGSRVLKQFPLRASSS